MEENNTTNQEQAQEQVTENKEQHLTFDEVFAKLKWANYDC
jgi:hypothetical protein